MENVAMVLFEVESEAYQALAELKRDAVNPSYTISQIALLKKQNGRILPCESFDSGVDTWDDTAMGGLLGGLIGILGGPIGVLFSGSMGALIGSAIDAGDAVKDMSMLERVSGRLPDGQTVLAALIQENDETAFDSRMAQFKTEILRWDAVVIAAEVEEAEKLEIEMQKSARAKLRAQKKEERRQDLEEKRAKICADFEAMKEKLKKA